MYFGHAAEAAIRGTLYLAGQVPGELSPVQEIAAATNLPRAYLSKVIQRLAQDGLVRTFRGPGGGIELAKPANAITLWSLVRATTGGGDADRCVLGIRNCFADNPCPLHGRWAPLRDEFQNLLEGTTLAELLRDFSRTQRNKRPTNRTRVQKGHAHPSRKPLLKGGVGDDASI